MSTTRRKNRHYDLDFKFKVVEEAISGELNKSALCRKYSISHPDLLRSWIRIFAPEHKFEENDMKKEKRTESEEVVELKRQLQQTKLALQKEKMRADFYNEMINVAEETLNIPIRKKAGTKQ